MEENIIIKRLVSSDGETKKFLFKLVDGQTVESVLMKCKHGHTICVSTQVGCKMNCAFCVTGNRRQNQLPVKELPNQFFCRSGILR